MTALWWDFSRITYTASDMHLKPEAGKGKANNAPVPRAVMHYAIINITKYSYIQAPLVIQVSITRVFAWTLRIWFQIHGNHHGSVYNHGRVCYSHSVSWKGRFQSWTNILVPSYRFMLLLHAKCVCALYSPCFSATQLSENHMYLYGGSRQPWHCFRTKSATDSFI
jgi:hypothetical protein